VLLLVCIREISASATSFLHDFILPKHVHWKLVIFPSIFFLLIVFYGFSKTHIGPLTYLIFQCISHLICKSKVDFCIHHFIFGRLLHPETPFVNSLFSVIFHFWRIFSLNISPHLLETSIFIYFNGEVLIFVCIRDISTRATSFLHDFILLKPALKISILFFIFSCLLLILIDFPKLLFDLWYISNLKCLVICFVHIWMIPAFITLFLVGFFTQKPSLEISVFLSFFFFDACFHWIFHINFWKHKVIFISMIQCSYLCVHGRLLPAPLHFCMISY